MPVVDTKFELCREVDTVLKIGRDYQNKDGYRGAHYDTVKLLCDTIEYLRDKIPKPDPDWKAVCEKCHDGEIEPNECEYYGEPNGCNSPIYGEHPTTEKSSAVGNAAAMREALEKLRAEIVRFYANEWIPYDAWQGCDEIISNALSAPSRNCDRLGGDEVKIFDCYIQERKYCKYKDLFPDYGFWLLKTAKTKGENDGR